MTQFIAYADHFGHAIQIIGTALALFFLVLITGEAALRERRKRRNLQRLQARTAQVIASATRTRPAL